MRALLAGPEIFILIGIVGIPLIFLIYFLFLSESAKNRRKMRERMKSLEEKNKKLKDEEGTPAARLRRDESSTALDRLARRVLPNPKVLRARLEATGKPLTMGKYFGLSILTGLIVGAAYWLFTDYPVAAAPFVGLAAGALIPHKMISRMITKRQELFVAQLAEALDLIVRGVKSGLPVAETINSVAEEMPEPIGQEFSRVMEDTRVGMTLETALWAAAERVQTTEFKFFVVTLTVQRETGGNLAETLDNLSELVRSRKQMKLKVKAMSSEARASQYILGGLPFGIAGILLLIAPQYILTLVNTSGGNWLLGIGLTMLAMGWFVMGRMVNFEI